MFQKVNTVEKKNIFEWILNKKTHITPVGRMPKTLCRTRNVADLSTEKARLLRLISRRSLEMLFSNFYILNVSEIWSNEYLFSFQMQRSIQLEEVIFKFSINEDFNNISLRQELILCHLDRLLLQQILQQILSHQWKLKLLHSRQSLLFLEPMIIKRDNIY